MLWDKLKSSGAWTPEEAYLLQMHEPIVCEVVLLKGDLNLMRDDGSWFGVVRKGVRCLRPVPFNVKEKLP